MAIYKDQDELLNTDWQAKINEAKNAGNLVLAAQYEQARNDKINSSAYTGKVTDTTDNYSQYLQHVGTNYHQNAIDAAAAGNWDDVTKYLGLREDKVAAEGGNNRGKTSAQIYQELLDQYGQKANEPTFDYSSYEETKPTYESSYSDRIDQMLNEILNRDAFSYNVENDPLYQQYKAQYQREGTRAMNDTLAEVAASAGGMNSYAITAAQQANNYYNAQLNDRIPELYQLAYDMYMRDIDNQVRDLGLLQEMDDSQYSRYRDTMSDWRDDRDFAYDKYRDDMGDYQYGQGDRYNRVMDSISAGVMPDEEMLAAAGISSSMAQSMVDQVNGQQGREDNKTAYNRVMDMIDMGIMPDDALLQSAGIDSVKAQEMVDRVLAAEDLKNGQYTNETAYNRAMDMIAMGVMPDNEILKAAGISAVTAQGMISAVKGESEIEPVQPEQNGTVPVKEPAKEPTKTPTTGGTGGTGGVATTGGASLMTYNDAINTLKEKGVSNDILIGIMDEGEWTKRKASYKAYGIGGDSVALNDTYAEYLENFIEYALSTKK